MPSLEYVGEALRCLCLQSVTASSATKRRDVEKEKKERGDVAADE